MFRLGAPLGTTPPKGDPRYHATVPPASNDTVPMRSPGAEGPSATPSLRVTVTAGRDRGQVYDIARISATIGRARTADVSLSDPTVSAFHCELTSVGEGVRVTDLGSRNGTLLGPVRVHSVTLPFGSEISLAGTTLRVERGPTFLPESSRSDSFGGLVGSAPAMLQLYAALERLAPTDLSIMIEGETGTGKEVAARAIHNASRRAHGPFLALDCTAIPASLAESVLFGHQKGAFTGANEKRVGIFEAAAGGTLLLDEIGELPGELQPKLLRVLERREVVPVGSTQPRTVDVRIVAATWRDLRTMVNTGRFREDLYYRLAQARVRMPSLAERAEDVAPLVLYLLAQLPADARAARAIAPDALALIASRSFPGNVRELKSTVERAALLAAGPTITLADLAFERVLSAAQTQSVTDPPITRPSSPPTASADANAPLEPFRDARRTVLDEFERGYLVRLLERAGSNLSQASRLARVDRQSLRELLVRHGLRSIEQ